MSLTIAGCSNNKAEVLQDSNYISSENISKIENTNRSDEFSFMNGKVCIPFKIKD